MSDAYKCGRCDELFEGTPVLRVEGVDLCNDCTDDYFKFLNGDLLAEEGLQQEPIRIAGPKANESTGIDAVEHKGSFKIDIKPSLTLNKLSAKPNKHTQVDDYMDNPEARNY